MRFVGSTELFVLWRMRVIRVSQGEGMMGFGTYVEAEEFFEMATGADVWREFLVGPCLRSTSVRQNTNEIQNLLTGQLHI
jgi:hypothetical protein